MYFGYLRLKINNAKPHDFFTWILVGGASTEEPHGDGAFGCWESFWETRCDCGWRGRLSHAPLEALGIQQVSTLLLQLLLENKQRPVGASYCQVASNFCHFSLKGIERWIIFISFLGCLKWFAIRKRTNAAEKLVKYWFFMRNRSGSPSKNIISRCQKEHASYREMSVTLFFFSVPWWSQKGHSDALLDFSPDPAALTCEHRWTPAMETPQSPGWFTVRHDSSEKGRTRTDLNANEDSLALKRVWLKHIGFYRKKKSETDIIFFQWVCIF